MKFKIEIIKNTNCYEYHELEKLIREFAINIFVVQKKELYNKTNLEKTKIIKNFDKNLSKRELELLYEDISSRLKLAKELINNKTKLKNTRFYIIKAEQDIIGFQTAQIRINNNKVEGWRNYAYIKNEYIGKIENVEDTYGKIRKGNISNIVYENITQWFKENNVTAERTATGKNMYKNILTYIVVKGFVPEKIDDERIFLVKEYNKTKSKNELKQIYKKLIQQDYLK